MNPPFHNVCRFCLRTGAVSIFERNADLGGRCAASFMESIALFQMDHSNHYPSKICHKCLTMITSFYCFIKHCETSQTVLRKWQSIVKTDKKPFTPFQEADHDYVGGHIFEPERDIQYIPSKNDANSKSDTVIFPERFECYYCMKIFKRKAYLRNHIKTMHLDDPDGGMVVCPVCGKMIKGHTNMKSHIRSVHEKTMSSCTVCDAQMSAKALNRHMLSHGEDISKKFLCKLCGRVLKSLKSLERHEKIHKDIRDFVCTQCNASFALKTTLNAHLRKHAGIPPKVFPCELCDKQFRGVHTLKRHQLWHSGIKPFSCKLCEKSFYTGNELKVHERQHQDTATKECVYCGKMFRNVSCLRLHIMAHKNVRPHACQICGKGFILRKKLVKHMWARHKLGVDSTERSWRDPQTYLTLNQLLEM